MGLFLIEVETSDGAVVEDLMFPDWPSLRFNGAPGVSATTREGAYFPGSIFTVSGPRSQEALVSTGSLRQWGVLMHPLGWARLVGASADGYANRVVDGMTDPVFAALRPLAETLFGPEPDAKGELHRLTAFFDAFEPIDEPAAGSIAAVYEALFAPEVESVALLAERAGIGVRRLERLCRRTFGFTPKMLLRRQRFLRSLIDFTADPSLRWVGALDAAYHDQAQFVRDFREFMGMTPSEYGQREKPIIGPVLRERARFGALRRALDVPGQRLVV